MENCDEGKFYVGGDNNTCIDCNPTCASCSTTSKDICTRCTGIYPYLYGEFCLSKCPNGFYGNLQNNHCQPCDKTNFSCETCSKQSYNCTSCVEPSSKEFLYKNECITECAANITITDPVKKECNECSPNCLECSSTID